MSTARWLRIPALLFALAGCASAPVAPVNADHEPEAKDEAALWYAMAEYEKELKQSASVEHDPQLNRYLSELTCAIAGDLCGDIRVYVVRSPLFNAYMTPNGVMVLFTGLLLRCQNEAELAFVIAHEVAHYRLRHSLKNWRRLKATGNFLSVVGMLSGVANGSLAAAATALGAYADLARFSREQEREADALGAQQAGTLGYDLNAASELWAAALEEERVNPAGVLGRVFASHPPSKERLAFIRAQAQPTGDRKMRPYQEQIDPFRKAWLDAEIGRRSFEQSEVMLRRLGSAGVGRGAVHFARAELHRMRDRPGDLSLAVSAYRQALKEVDAPIETHRQLGLVLRRLNQLEAARAAFRKYLELAPNAPDHALIESYL